MVTRSVFLRVRSKARSYSLLLALSLPFVAACGQKASDTKPAIKSPNLKGITKRINFKPAKGPNEKQYLETQAKKAEEVLLYYFLTVESGNMDDRLAFYGPLFFEISEFSKEQWTQTLLEAQTRCGKAKRFKPVRWNAGREQSPLDGTRTFVEFHCEVDYEHDHTLEKITLYKEGDSDLYRICGHHIEGGFSKPPPSPTSAPAPSN